jgi:catechol 2,3-dioxygenase-like lactoylglutathione lyase family enzyme
MVLSKTNQCTLHPNNPSLPLSASLNYFYKVKTLLKRDILEKMATVQVRYIVNNVDEAIKFYCTHLDFHEDMHPAPSFAMLSRGDLRLVLSSPNTSGGGGQAMPDGTKPQPGGWNRFSIEIEDLEEKVKALRNAGVKFRNDIVKGVGGNQILIEDPSGNPIELFQPVIDQARLS